MHFCFEIIPREWAAMLVAIVLCFWCAVVVRSADVHLYVSPTGSDNNNGLTITTPLRTLEKAFERLQDSDVSGNAVYIELRAGYHDVKKTITLSGKTGHPITVRAYKDEEVHIVRQLRFQDAGIPLSQLSRLSKYGANIKRMAGTEVFYNGKPLTLARYPNTADYIAIATTPDGKDGHRFTYPQSLRGRAERWQHEADLWLYGFWYWSWCDETAHVTRVFPDNDTIVIDSYLSHGLKPGLSKDTPNGPLITLNGFFSVFNALSELDQAGEYYIDRDEGILYVWPPEHSGAVNNDDVIYASMIDTIFKFTDVANLTFENLVLESSRYMAVIGEYLHSCTFKKLEVKNTGSFGLSLTKSDHLTVRQCEFHDTDGGLIIEGGDHTHLISSGNLIENNHFWRFSRAVAFQSFAVNLGGVGALVQYNEIHDSRWTGFWWFGNNHVIRRNHVHHTCQGSSDCGGIQSGRDWSYRGNVIQENHFHDILLKFGGSAARAIMLDDQYASVTIERNVFYNNNIHINIGGGRDNVIRDNVFVNSTANSLSFDGRGLSPTDGNRAFLYRKLNHTPISSPEWKSSYPKLAAIYSQKPDEPMGNQIYHNVFRHVSSDLAIKYNGHIYKKEYFDVHDNYLNATTADFNIPTSGDFRLVCGAAKWASGNDFPSIPTLAEVGPHLPFGPNFKQVKIPLKTNAPLHRDCAN